MLAEEWSMSGLPSILKVLSVPLKVKNIGRPCLLMGQQKVVLIDYIGKQGHFCKGKCLNGEMLQTFIQRTFAVNYHQNSTYNFLKSLGISWTTSRSKNLKQSEEAQENLKNNIL
jgi:transposase